MSTLIDARVMPETARPDIADRLFEAHVAHELAAWRGRRGDKRLARLVDAFWDWAERTTLAEVIDCDTVRGAAERLALDLELPDQLAAVIGSIADELVRLDVNRETRVRDVIDQALFDDGVALAVELENLRVRLIQRLLKSPVYTALASDVLYQGIKDYIFSDSGAIRSIPGVSRLIKGSSSAVSRRMPGLEAQVESRVKAYIEANTARTLARTEALLLDSLDGDRLRALADEIWAAMADQPLSIADAVASHELQRLVDYGLQVWRSLRETEYLGVMIDQGVQAYFARHGDDTLAELMGHVGIDRQVVADEVAALAPDLIAGLADTGLLETLVRDQLADFYGSKEFAKALG
ncbi:hypothetical protein [Salinisphaera hydrothermalis]|uniref:Uncharacterized protein n=1 Tax=Salinisphaera hydrothermalis (strain C41B8) TaxID=1304275 RepID=A0A084IN28_SALHC|nr:hypothetical protein [Salinisphaera hydrothermalis]KEZ78112.1 hypothetical protein C41B8_05992 [Salinisphaera hydrothermalis C41B8]